MKILTERGNGFTITAKLDLEQEMATAVSSISPLEKSYEPDGTGFQKVKITSKWCLLNAVLRLVWKIFFFKLPHVIVIQLIQKKIHNKGSVLCCHSIVFQIKLVLSQNGLIVTNKNVVRHVHLPFLSKSKHIIFTLFAFNTQMYLQTCYQ